MPSTKLPTDFADGISNETICTYFFAAFVVITLLVAISIVSRAYLERRRPYVALGVTLATLPYLALSSANALFLYLMCTRSLLK